jgi:hypothetical protein
MPEGAWRLDAVDKTPAPGQGLARAIVEAEQNVLCATRQGVKIPDANLKVIVGLRKKGSPDQ